MNTDKIYAEQLANEYAPKKTSKVVALRKLDAKAKLPATVFTYTLGIVSALVFGVGMCLSMKVIGDGSMAMRMPDAFDTHGTLNMIRGIIDPILSRFGVPADRREYMMAYYLNGISAVVGEWLKDDCRDPVDMMISVIEQCVLAGYYGRKYGLLKNST